MNMTDIVEYISYLIAGIIIAPFGFMLFKEFIGEDRKTVTDEVKSTVGDESRKFLGGRYGDAVVGQFFEFKLIIAIGLPVVLFLGISSLVNSLFESSVQPVSCALTNCSRGIRNAWHFYYALV